MHAAHASLRRLHASARRGSVIVVVLVMIMLASLMLVKFMESSAVELTLATRQADRDRLRTDAFSALETFLAVLAEIKALDDDRINAPAQGWGDPYGYAGASPREGVTVDFAITDESGKLSLPTVSFDDLVELAQVLGLGEADARRFADGLFGWMREDHVAQDIDADPAGYEREDPPITVPRRSLRSWEELRSVRVAREYVYDENGALTPFGVALRENLSLYRYEGVNINALAPALGTARGWDETQLQQIAAYRAGLGARPPGAPSWFRRVGELRAVLGANADTRGLDADAKLLRVEITVREGASSMMLRVLVALDNAVALPAVAQPPAVAGAGAAATTPPATPAQTPAPASAPAAEERLNYPFRILELIETSGPPPLVLTDEELLSEDPSL